MNAAASDASFGNHVDTPSDRSGSDAQARQLARQFQASQSSQHALAAWKAVDSKSPGDREAAVGIADAVIHECRVREGLVEPPAALLEAASPLPEASTPSKAGTRFDIDRAVEALSQNIVGITRTPIQQLETAVREFPSHPEIYLELAPLYLSRGRLFDADRLLSKGVTATGQDVRVRQMWEDVTLLRLQEEIRLARVEVEKHDEATTRSLLETAEREYDRVKLDVLQNRAKREPENGDILHQLGMHLKSAGRWREAIKAFHQAIADARFTPQAAFEAGDTYEHEGDWAAALRLYRLAAQPSLVAHRPDVRRQALERAARLATQLHLPALAKYYQEKLQSFGGSRESASAAM